MTELRHGVAAALIREGIFHNSFGPYLVNRPIFGTQRVKIERIYTALTTHGLRCGGNLLTKLMDWCSFFRVATSSLWLKPVLLGALLKRFGKVSDATQVPPHRHFRGLILADVADFIAKFSPALLQFLVVGLDVATHSRGSIQHLLGYLAPRSFCLGAIAFDVWLLSTLTLWPGIILGEPLKFPGHQNIGIFAIVVLLVHVILYIVVSVRLAPQSQDNPADQSWTATQSVAVAIAVFSVVIPFFLVNMLPSVELRPAVSAVSHS